MPNSTPILFIPGLLCTAELFAAQIPALEKFGPVTVADHRQNETMSELARAILDKAPPKFALAGLSMGGYVAFEIMRQAPERVLKLALMSTSARPDSSEQTQSRLAQIAAAASDFEKVITGAIPFLFHRDDQPENKKVFMKMVRETGYEAFVRQQKAIISRADSRPLLASIKCPTLALVGRNDRMTPPELIIEIASGISGSRYMEIDNCGHTATLEQAELVTEQLVQWIRD